MSREYTIPGFPEEVSQKIDMPDIGELLSYPMWNVSDAETVWKYGSEFQRKLISMSPLRHNRKHVTILSNIHLVFPNMRAMTTKTKMTASDWHIDGIDYPLDGNDSHKDHLVPYETCHLLLGHTRFVTEFNIHPVVIKDEKLLELDRMNFSAQLGSKDSPFKLEPKAVELGRIYTFDNHIHRAVEPTHVELRFTWRIRETDRPDMPPPHQQIVYENRYLDIESQQWLRSLDRRGERISLFFPKFDGTPPGLQTNI